MESCCIGVLAVWYRFYFLRFAQRCFSLVLFLRIILLYYMLVLKSILGPFYLLVLKYLWISRVFWHLHMILTNIWILYVLFFNLRSHTPVFCGSASYLVFTICLQIKQACKKSQMPTSLWKALTLGYLQFGTDFIL